MSTLFAPLTPAAAGPRVFGPEYTEPLELRDGTRACLRPIHPGDKEQLAAGLLRLSPQSRYLRFFTDKERLTETELRYLTEVDGEDHFALGILRLDDDGHEVEGLGIGRFVRIPDEPHVAEPALAVVDDAQGLGLGRLLLLRLIAAATERDVRVFRCDFLAINQGMEALLRNVSSQVEFRSEGPVVTAEFALPQVPANAPPERASRLGPMFVWFKLVAGQVMELRRMFEEHGEQLRQQWRLLQRELGRLRRGGGDDDS